MTQRILITGGTGSLGSALVHQYAASASLTILSKDIHHQAALRKLYPHLRYVLADICDAAAVTHACLGQDVVIHTAALKRVELGEAHPAEYARVNIQGTLNVAEAAQACGVPRCLMISTDKAVEAVNHYGKTKAVAEGLWLNHDTTGSDTRSNFSVLRYGNVLSSQGSVWHYWQALLQQGKRIPVRTPEPTRFLLTMDQALALIADALDQMANRRGTIYLPAALPAFSVHDLARTFCPPPQWQLLPLERGEKQHEVLLAAYERARPVSDLLYAVDGEGELTMDRAAFCSRSAPRLTGKDVMDLMQKGAQ